MKPVVPLSLLLLVLLTNPAWAYLDPGSVSMGLQVILAALVGALVTLKLYWHKFVGFFSKKNKLNDDISK